MSNDVGPDKDHFTIVISAHQTQVTTTKSGNYNQQTERVRTTAKLDSITVRGSTLETAIRKARSFLDIMSEEEEDG